MNIERIKMLEMLMEEQPKDPFNRHALAMEYYEADPDKALLLLQENLSEHPEYLPTYFKLSHLYWDNENWSAATKIFQLGIKLAQEQNDEKALSELNAAYLNFQFDMD